MKNKVDILEYIKNFDGEIEAENDWINLHLNIMHNELVDIQNALNIFNVVDNELDRRVNIKEKISYSTIRTILHDSLPYKIFMGLSKILSGDSGYTLQKTINMISQRDEYKNNDDVKKIIKEINTFLSGSNMVNIVTTCRDQFYAHLDKECVLSDLRIDVSILMKEIKNSELTSAILLIGRLYETCFGEKINYSAEEINSSDVIYTFFWMTDSPEKNMTIEIFDKI